MTKNIKEIIHKALTYLSAIYIIQALGFIVSGSYFNTILSAIVIGIVSVGIVELSFASKNQWRKNIKAGARGFQKYLTLIILGVVALQLLSYLLKSTLIDTPITLLMLSVFSGYLITTTVLQTKVYETTIKAFEILFIKLIGVFFIWICISLVINEFFFRTHLH